MSDTSNTRGRLTVVRHFKAPIQMVFDAFASAKSMLAWWGSKESPVTVDIMEFKAGGIFLYSMDMMGHKVFGRFSYKRIESPTLIKFIFSFANEKGEPVRAFFAADWPLEVLNLVEFTEANGVTTITMSGHPINASAEEIAMYQSNLPNMEQGFTGTFDRLDLYLS